MSKLRVLAFVLLTATALLVFACVAYAPGGATPLSPFTSPIATPPRGAVPMTLTLTFDMPPTLNQPVAATLTLQSAVARETLNVHVYVWPATGAERQQFTLPIAGLHANEPLRVPLTLRFPAEGTYHVYAEVPYQGGALGQTGLTIFVGAGGWVLNPTVQPGPAAAPVVPRTAPPDATPPSLPAATATPAAPPVGRGAASQGTSPVSTPDSCSGSLITISGSVQYDERVDAGTPPRVPAPYVKVEAWDNNGPGAAGQSPDVMLGSTFALADGTWSIPNVCNTETSPGDGNCIDLYVMFYADTNGSVNPQGTPGPAHRALDPAYLPYVAYSWETKGSTWSEQCSTASGYSPWVDTNTTNHEAMWLLDDGYRAWSFIKGNVLASVNDPGQLDLYWHSGWNTWPPLCPDGSCFWGVGAFIGDIDAIYSPDAVIHEVGHAYKQWISGVWFPECQGLHYIFTPSTQQCAWQEGWADFFPLQVGGGHCYDRRTVEDCANPDPDLSVNLEAPTWGYGQPPLGDSVEGRVAGALLDMHDAPQDGVDDTQYGFFRTWNIVNRNVEAQNELQTLDFYNHWKGYSNYGSVAPPAAPFYQSTIAYLGYHAHVPAIFRTASLGGVSYSSGIKIQNLSTSDAPVFLRYYNHDGTLTGISALSVPANSLITIYPLNVQNGFAGSLEADSDADFRITDNLLTSSPSSLLAAKNAVLAGSPTVNLPLITCGNAGYDTWFSVQNTGSSVASVSVQYIAGGPGNNASEGPYDIEPGAAMIFQQAGGVGSTTINCSTGLGGMFVGSATVTGSQPLAVAVYQVNTTNTPTLMGYTGFGAGSPTILLPEINANNSNFYTGIKVQNLGTANTTVTIQYSPNTGGGGTPVAEYFDLAPGASRAIIQNGAPPGNGSINDWNLIGQYVGGATISNNGGQPLAAVVNQVRLTLSPYLSACYEGLDPTSATASASLPLIQANNSTYYTGVQVQNVTGYPEGVTLHYTPNTAGPNNPVDEVFVLPPNGTKTIIQNGAPPGNGSLNNWNLIGQYVGSAIISASGSVVAIVNQISMNLPGDQLACTDAFNY